jgi:hypothetical protein
MKEQKKKVEVAALLQKLDELLNPKWYTKYSIPEAAVAHRVEFTKKILDEIEKAGGLLDWIVDGQLIYLSDGGYSRVFYSAEHMELFVASESTDRIHNEWEENQDVICVRKGIEELLKSVLLEDMKSV